jgi:serine/threonine protein phosphatase 1
MAVLVVGDVHGCYYTLKSLVSTYWDPTKDQLVLVGDFINKGPNSAKTLRYLLKKKREFPNRVFLIRGNHEQWFLDCFRKKSRNPAYLKLLEDFNELDFKENEVANILRLLPLSWENDSLLISHAGLAIDALDPFDISTPDNVLINRKPLKLLPKFQVIGHTVVRGDKPLYRPKENAWYIDTGAWYRSKLSGLRFSEEKQHPEIIQVEVELKDRKRAFQIKAVK